MNIAEQIKKLRIIAEELDIDISEINEPEYSFSCGILKDNQTYQIVLNLSHIETEEKKCRALKWAIECCVDNNKTEWRDLNDISTDDTNRP